jgi:superfamily II DNA or RNA helicase
VHQAKAEVLKKLLTVNFSKSPIRWGLTGTIPKEKFEYESIRCSIGEVINHVTANQLQEKGILAQCHVNILQITDIREFRSYAEEYKYLVTDSERIDWLADKVKEIVKTGNTLVLVNRIDTGKMLIDRIKDSVFISGEVKTKDRKDEYDEVKTSDDKIIIATYGVAAVGINIPRIFNLVLVEPGKSFVRVIQSIGRGIRKAEDKDFVQIWDITSTCKYAKRHLTERKKFYKDAKYPFLVTKTNI